MASVTIRELSRNTGQVLDEVQQTGRPALVTRNGRLVAALIPLDDEALEDFVLASLPEFVAGRAKADAELATGDTRSLDDVLDEISKD